MATDRREQFNEAMARIPFHLTDGVARWGAEEYAKLLVFARKVDGFLADLGPEATEKGERQGLETWMVHWARKRHTRFQVEFVEKYQNLLREYGAHFSDEEVFDFVVDDYSSVI